MKLYLMLSELAILINQVMWLSKSSFTFTHWFIQQHFSELDAQNGENNHRFPALWAVTEAVREAGIITNNVKTLYVI